MKKILVSIVVLGILACVSPALAQRPNPGPQARYHYDHHDRGHHREQGARKNRHHADNRHRGHGEKHWSDDRSGGRHAKAKHGRKQGHCRKATPHHAPRRGHHRG